MKGTESLTVRRVVLNPSPSFFFDNDGQTVALLLLYTAIPPLPSPVCERLESSCGSRGYERGESRLLDELGGGFGGGEQDGFRACLGDARRHGDGLRWLRERWFRVGRPDGEVF